LFPEFVFTGHKNSFFGDLHVMGKDGFSFYTETKCVTSTWFPEDETEYKKVDTWDGTPSDKAEFVTAMENAERSSQGYVLALNPAALRYAASSSGAFGNSIDIWEDQLDAADAPERKQLRQWIAQASKLLETVRHD